MRIFPSSISNIISQTFIGISYLQLDHYNTCDSGCEILFYSFLFYNQWYVIA